ncbi:MAG: prolipoprotein diacylglyceryl transferase, partial [Candidatus Aminicenantes bacterium]|nr:prolipoprotein diacylglyceryl transferase [Candidatus Aminicenantes bacterium]
AKVYGVVFALLKNTTGNAFNIGFLWEEFKSGGIFYGGAIAGLVFSFFYLRKYFRGNEWKVADITVIGVALGHVLGRIGCFCAGCCYGKVTDLPWGVKFAFHSGKPHEYMNAFVHPTQIYEAVLNLLNFFILLLIWKKRKFTGQVFSLYLINYGIIRFFIEVFRNDGGRGYLLKVGHPVIFLSYPQLISIILIAIGITVLVKRARESKEMVDTFS